MVDVWSPGSQNCLAETHFLFVQFFFFFVPTECDVKHVMLMRFETHSFMIRYTALIYMLPVVHMKHIEAIQTQFTPLETLCFDS